MAFYKRYLHKHVVKELAMQICEGRAFQDEGTASAKSQGGRIVVEFEEQQGI